MTQEVPVLLALPCRKGTFFKTDPLSGPGITIIKNNLKHNNKKNKLTDRMIHNVIHSHESIKLIKRDRQCGSRYMLRMGERSGRSNIPGAGGE